MMDRHEFVRWLAVIAAGAAALPEQIAAFERYYEVNTPQVAEGLVSIDEIFISGMATKSTPCLIEIADPKMKFGVNLFGGILRWVAMPNGKIIRPAHLFTWRLTPWPEDDVFVGQISFVDQNARRHYRPIKDGALV
jgi:hypothetical protein